MVFVPKCYTWVYRLVLRVCKHWFTLLYMCAPLTHHCTLYRAGRAWKRSTSRQRRQLPETLVIRNDLFIYGSNSGLYILFLASQHRRRIKTEEKAKVVAVGWGDVLECRTNHLAARMYGTKVFGRTSIFVGLWFGIV